MEEQKDREQPQTDENNVQSEIVKNEEEGTTCENDSESGSLGKFKDTDSLLNAYNNLQAEFTRKCQKLSEVTKELQGSTQNETMSNKVYQEENWKQNVNEFLTSHSEAKKYSGDIANEILQDQDLQMSPNALELAWARVMQKNFAEPDILAHDQNFINEKILNRDEIKTQVLEEYFKNLHKQKSPLVIGGSGEVAVPKTNAPQNMAEAKELVEKLFNLKG